MDSGPGSRSPRRIRVLLVDDSPIALEIIRHLVSAAPDIEVAGTARDGVEALTMIPRLAPDVICTDLHMPRMDGLELTRQVMARFPLPILVLSVSVQPDQTRNTFEMLEAGALDILAKPRGGFASDFGVVAQDLITKIRILSGVKVFARRPARAAAATRFPAAAPGARPPATGIIGIGASTGGPQALETLLGELPEDFPIPIICVQHIAAGFMAGLVSWLAASCRIRIVTVDEGARPQAGYAYFPEDGRHIEIDDDGAFRCSSALPISGYRPSVDLAFSSLARRSGPAAIGVLLTGMGQDGAQGLLDIARAGGATIAQDEASSVVFGMPKRAIELGAARQVLPVDAIAPALVRIANGPLREARLERCP